MLSNAILEIKHNKELIESIEYEYKSFMININNNTFIKQII